MYGVYYGLVRAGINFESYRLDLLWLIAAIVELVGCIVVICQPDVNFVITKSGLVQVQSRSIAKQRVPTEQ